MRKKQTTKEQEEQKSRKPLMLRGPFHSSSSSSKKKKKKKKKGRKSFHKYDLNLIMINDMYVYGGGCFFFSSPSLFYLYIFQAKRSSFSIPPKNNKFSLFFFSLITNTKLTRLL